MIIRVSVCRLICLSVSCLCLLVLWGTLPGAGGIDLLYWWHLNAGIRRAEPRGVCPHPCFSSSWLHARQRPEALSEMWPEAATRPTFRLKRARSPCVLSATCRLVSGRGPARGLAEPRAGGEVPACVRDTPRGDSQSRLPNPAPWL